MVIFCLQKCNNSKPAQKKQKCKDRGIMEVLRGDRISRSQVKIGQFRLDSSIVQSPKKIISILTFI